MDRQNGHHPTEPSSNGLHSGSNIGPMTGPKTIEKGVRAEGVWASYGQRQVLRGLELEVSQGTLMALAGPNGVGKSTLLRIIAGSLSPTRGTIRVMGSELSSLGGRDRARMVAMVPQNPDLPRGMTALEVTLMGRNPHLRMLSWGDQ